MKRKATAPPDPPPVRPRFLDPIMPTLGRPGQYAIRLSRGAVGAHEGTLMQYLFAARMLNEPIEGAELARLRRANDAVAGTRALLRHGRGNVGVDLRASGNQSAIRVATVRAAMETFAVGLDEPSELAQMHASLAACMGAGNCGEFAAVGVHEYARRAVRGEAVHHVRQGALHEWAEVRDADGVGRPGDRVIDPWAEGPAILRRHARFAHPPEAVRSRYRYAVDLAREAGQDMRELARDLQRPGVANTALMETYAALNQAAEGFTPDPGAVGVPETVLGLGFRRRVEGVRRRRLDPLLPVAARRKGALLQELTAAGVWRSLGASVREATAPQRTHAALFAHLLSRQPLPPRGAPPVRGFLSPEF